MEIKIYDEWQTNSLKLIIAEEKENRLILYNLYSNEVKEISVGERIPDEFVMKMPQRWMAKFNSAIIDYMNKQGLKTKNEATIEGKLEATSYHLEDLRRLLKLGGKNAT